jgi:ABC-type transport system substrate-binding protein
LALAACTSSAGGPGPSGGKPKVGGDLVIAGPQAIDTLDKDRAATSNDALRVIENVYDRLYVLDEHGASPS